MVLVKFSSPVYWILEHFDTPLVSCRCRWSVLVTRASAWFSCPADSLSRLQLLAGRSAQVLFGLQREQVQPARAPRVSAGVRPTASKCSAALRSVHLSRSLIHSTFSLSLSHTHTHTHPRHSVRTACQNCPANPTTFSTSFKLKVNLFLPNVNVHRAPDSRLSVSRSCPAAISASNVSCAFSRTHPLLSSWLNLRDPFCSSYSIIFSVI